jgi:hypothetical protein
MSVGKFLFRPHLTSLRHAACCPSPSFLRRACVCVLTGSVSDAPLLIKASTRFLVLVTIHKFKAYGPNTSRCSQPFTFCARGGRWRIVGRWHTPTF